jgi:two-component sensor histidine kinase
MDTLNKIFRFSRSFRFIDNFKNYLRVIFIWCPVVTVLFIFGFGGFDQLFRRISTSMIIATTVASSCFLGSWLLNYFYRNYRLNRGFELKKEGLYWGVLTSYPFLLPGLYLGFSLAGKYNAYLGYQWTSPQFNDYSSGIIFGIMVSGMFTLFQVIRESKEAKQAAELKFKSLENEKLKAQVSALTAQMNPHLLFNSLNTIASTITTDPHSAEDMIVQLSELYRGILKSAKGDMHSLENELLLCKSYLEIEKKRFGPRIEYRIHVDRKIDPKKINIPVLLLQPLVENSVKHGISPKRQGGTIFIQILREEQHLSIEVRDNGVGLHTDSSSKGTGTGLSNCESRIKLKYGDHSKFKFFRNEKNETTVLMRIPISEALCD